MIFDSDVKDSFYGPAKPRRLPGAKQDTQPDEAYLKDWLARSAEIVDKYQPELIWFDWWIEQPVFQPYLQKFTAYYYNRGAEWKRGVAINYKNKSFPEHAVVLDVERGQLDTMRALFWQTDTFIITKSLAAGSPLSKREIKTVELLGSHARLKWTRAAQGLVIDLPPQKPGDYAFAFKIAPVDQPVAAEH